MMSAENGGIQGKRLQLFAVAKQALTQQGLTGRDQCLKRLSCNPEPFWKSQVQNLTAGIEMGKKSKANKLAKMSEEERARYLQLRADIEEEARRRKMHLISLFMKHKIKREDAFCRLNMAKINQEWRSILRQVKCQELKRELGEMQEFFQQRLDSKNQTIQRLFNEMDIAEDMYETMWQGHMEIIRRLISTQQERKNVLQRMYEDERDGIIAECLKDFEDYQRARDAAQLQLENVVYQLEDMRSKEVTERKDRHLKQLDNVKSEMQVRLEDITRDGETKLEAFWQEYQDVLSGYVKHTEDYFADYLDLKETDVENAALMREHDREIERATEQLAQLKIVAADATEKQDLKVNYLQGVKNDLHEKLKALKEKVDGNIKADKERFKMASVESHKVLKHLKGLVAKGKILLQLAQVCGKLETERERCVSIDLPSVGQDAVSRDRSEFPHTPEHLKLVALDNWPMMENFWRRVNNATIDVMCLKRDRRQLLEENEHLKLQLQEYLVNLNLSNNSNSHIDAYLTRRPQSMQVHRVTPVGLETRSKSQSAGSRRGRISVGGGRSGGGGGVYRPMTTSYVEANLCNAVRSRALLRGKPKLAKIESLVTGNTVRNCWN